MHSIIVNIDAEGEVKVEAQGVVGSGCQALTRALETDLGVTTGDVKTREYHQQQTQANAAKAGQ